MRYLISKFGLNLLLALLLSACASQVPQAIRDAPAGSPSLAEVRVQPTDYLGRQVRWGGTIIETVNREHDTWLTLLGRPLTRYGEPAVSDESDGRFIATVPEFLDPKVYLPGRHVTISGALARTEAGKVGEYPYTYAVVQADAWHLWPVKTERDYGYEETWGYDTRLYNPWIYRPWHDPWYPYGYPYRLPHLHRH